MRGLVPPSLNVARRGNILLVRWVFVCRVRISAACLAQSMAGSEIVWDSAGSPTKHIEYSVHHESNGSASLALYCLMNWHSEKDMDHLLPCCPSPPSQKDVVSSGVSVADGTQQI